MKASVDTCSPRTNKCYYFTQFVADVTRFITARLANNKICTVIDDVQQHNGCLPVIQTFVKCN